MTSLIRTAVVTGRHAFDVPAFYALFRSMPEVDFYMQDLDNLVADTEGVFDQYDVLLFYNMHTVTPEGRMKAMLQRLGTSRQGIFVKHHALLAFPEWPFWSALCGIQDRSFEYYHDQTLDIEVVDPAHPITAGMASWTMTDETYLMNDAGVLIAKAERGEMGFWSPHVLPGGRWAVFTATPLSFRGRAIFSNIIGTPLDSVVFVYLAFGPIWEAMWGQTLVKLASSLLIVFLVKNVQEAEFKPKVLKSEVV